MKKLLVVLFLICSFGYSFTVTTTFSGKSILFQFQGDTAFKKNWEYNAIGKVTLYYTNSGDTSKIDFGRYLFKFVSFKTGANLQSEARTEIFNSFLNYVTQTKVYKVDVVNEDFDITKNKIWYEVGDNEKTGVLNNKFDGWTGLDITGL